LCRIGRRQPGQAGRGAVGAGEAVGELVDELLQGGEQFAVGGFEQGALDGGGAGCCTPGR